MCASAWTRGAPDVSRCLRRDRLLKTMLQGESHVCVLIAPSGHGKTVAAAQLALEHECSLWIDAPNCAVNDGRALAQATLRALLLTYSDSVGDQMAVSDAVQLVDLLDAIESTLLGLGDRSICIVVDDISSENLGDAVLAAYRISASLRSHVTFVITARELGEATEALVRHSVIVGPDELMLTEAEAVELSRADSIADSVSSAEALGLRAECRGHVALFTVLSRARAGKP